MDPTFVLCSIKRSALFVIDDNEKNKKKQKQTSRGPQLPASTPSAEIPAAEVTFLLSPFFS